MKASEYLRYDATGLAGLIANGDITSREACEAALGIHAATNTGITAVIETWAEDIDTSIAAADPASPLCGVPFFIKDILLAMEGKRCEGGSRIAKDYVAPFSSALMTRFRKAGLITLGRTKTPEFGFSPTTEPLFPGPARNPWNPAHSTGGSSGGAGAVVGARVAPLAHASDGAGSIRIPAAACGVVGLKPTRGRISSAPHNDEVLFGMGIEFVHSRTVRDSALMLDLVHGPEVGEPYEIASPPLSYSRAIAAAPGKLRIGVMPHPLGGVPTVPEVLHSVEAVARLCEDLGHEIAYARPDIGMDWDTFTEMEGTAWCIGVHSWIDAMAETTGRRPSEDMLQPETYAAYRHGKEQDAKSVMRVLSLRNVATRSFAAFFQTYDILLSPTLATLPYPLGAFSHGWGETGLDWSRYVFDRCPFTPIFNVTGLPAISLPLGHDEASDLPIGIQFGAGFGREDLLLQLSAQLEKAYPWIDRMPSLTRALT